MSSTVYQVSRVLNSKTYPEGGKSVPHTEVKRIPEGDSELERLFPSYVPPVCGSPEGSRPSDALPYGKGGVGWVET
ncbi:hypothetical protein J53TS2_15820 [Paenibacillus sp. J53TS2]|nr:hypothetical protein J53TS2_15820 [Paenibacillus sp. J53TS2]